MAEVKDISNEVKVAIPEITDYKLAEQYLTLLLIQYPNKIPKGAFLPLIPVFWQFDLIHYLMRNNISPNIITGLVDYFPELFDRPVWGDEIEYLMKNDQLKKLDKIIIGQYRIVDEFIPFIMDIKKHHPQINIYVTLDVYFSMQTPAYIENTIKLHKLCLEHNIKFKLYSGSSTYKNIVYSTDLDKFAPLVGELFEQINWPQIWTNCIKNIITQYIPTYLSLYPIFVRPEFIEHLRELFWNKFNFPLMSPERFHLIPDQDRYKIFRSLLYTDPSWLKQHDLFESNQHLIDNSFTIPYNFTTKAWFEKYPDLFNACEIEINMVDFPKFTQPEIMYCVRRLEKFRLSSYNGAVLCNIYHSLTFDDQIEFILKFKTYSTEISDIHRDRGIETYIKYKDFLNYCDEVEHES